MRMGIGDAVLKGTLMRGTVGLDCSYTGAVDGKKDDIVFERVWLAEPPPACLCLCRGTCDDVLSYLMGQGPRYLLELTSALGCWPI